MTADTQLQRETLDERCPWCAELPDVHDKNNLGLRYLGCPTKGCIGRQIGFIIDHHWNTRRAAIAGPRGDDTALVETLAALAHEQWSNWMKYLFKQCWPDDEQGGMVIPKDHVKRWKRQMKASYLELGEPERESDRAKGRRMVEVFRAATSFPTPAESVFIPTADTGLNCVYNRHSYCTKAYCDCTCHAAPAESTRVAGEQEK